MGSMRKLKTKDMFAFARLIKNLNLKTEIMEISKKADKISDVWDYGFEMIYAIFEHAADEAAEIELYTCLAPVLEVSEDELAEMELDELAEVLREFAKLNDVRRFFRNAAALTT